MGLPGAPAPRSGHQGRGSPPQPDSLVPLQQTETRSFRQRPALSGLGTAGQSGRINGSPPGAAPPAGTGHPRRPGRPERGWGSPSRRTAGPPPLTPGPRLGSRAPQSLGASQPQLRLHPAPQCSWMLPSSSIPVDQSLPPRTPRVPQIPVASRCWGAARPSAPSMPYNPPNLCYIQSPGTAGPSSAPHPSCIQPLRAPRPLMCPKACPGLQWGPDSQM